MTSSNACANIEFDYEQFVKNHPNFSHFINKIPFEKYLNEYTILTHNNLDTAKQKIEPTNENMNLIKKISNVLTDPTIVDLIMKKLLDLS